jgi:outer membrane protein OmpA-like peptidoglycan-associated protein
MLSTLAITGSYSPVYSQPLSDSERAVVPVYGAFIGYNLVRHTSSFDSLPGIPNCCQGYENGGSGNGFSFGVFYEMPFSKALALSLRLRYDYYGSTLKSLQETEVIIDTTPTAATFEHVLKTTLGSLDFEPAISLRLFSRFKLQAGVSAGYVMTKNFQQHEDLISPEVGSFENGKRTRNEQSGPIPEAQSFALKATGRLIFQMPLNSLGTWNAFPEASYTYNITPIIKNYDWASTTLRFGVGVGYSPLPDRKIPPPPQPPPAPPPPPPPPPEEKKPILAANLQVTGIDKDGNEKPIKFVIEEFISKQLRPLLNYVFFTEGSKDLRPEYTVLTEDETKKFFVDKLYNYETLQLYYQLLNIIGKRLIDHPKSKITLVGCNSDLRVEANNTQLSRQRAETVREYFKTVWHIAENRMNIQVRNLPEKASTETTEDGIMENQRVEIQCEDWEILKPVLTIDTMRVPRPPIVRFKPFIKAEAGVANWKVSAQDQSHELKAFAGTTMPDPKIDYRLDKEKQRVLAGIRTFKYQLKADDQVGQHVETPLDSLPVERLTLAKKKELHIADTVFSTYNLILFDFAKSNLTPSNQRIADYIKENVLSTDLVTIRGYADRIGSIEYNKNLSYGRALSTSVAVGRPDATVEGIGNTELLYDNDVPEGRFYCRTVTVFVASPKAQ